MSGTQHRIDELNEEIHEKQIERDMAVDENDPDRVNELDLEIEALNDDLKRFEMIMEKAAS